MRMKNLNLKAAAAFTKLFVLLLIMCSTLCQSTNVNSNSKVVNNSKKLPFDGFNSNSRDIEFNGEDLEIVEDSLSSSHEFNHHTDLLNPEYDGNGFDKLQANALVFLLEPENEYVLKSKPAFLKCKTANALQVSVLGINYREKISLCRYLILGW